MILTFTMFGPFIMLILDVVQKIEALGVFLTVWFTGKNRNRIVPKMFERIYLKVFGINMHEIECFETQKKYSQLVFEDFLMISLNLFMFLSILNVPQLTKEMDL